MKKVYKIIIADDNKFFLDALENYLESFDDFKVITTCSTINKTISYTNNTCFDLLILDLSFKGERSLNAIDKIRPNEHDFKIICLTSFNNSVIQNEVYTNGIDYFMGKDMDLVNFPRVIRKLLDSSENTIPTEDKNPKKELSLRQIEIIKACFEYSTEKDIASHLDISINTLKSHKQILFNKTNAKNNLELIKYGIKEGIIII